MFEVFAATSMRYSAVPILWAALAIAGCSPRPAPVPDVLGIPFAVPVNDIKNYLPEGAKSEQYPFVPFGPVYGYKLEFPNPENWTVLVQEEAPEDLREKRIFLIYISRTLDRSCARNHTEELIGTLAKKYQPQFDASFIHKAEEEIGFAFVAVSDRRMLQARVLCFGNRIGASFTYIDLDRYQYQDPVGVEKGLSDARREAKEYRSRSFK